jgi:hypothetical protein
MAKVTITEGRKKYLRKRSVAERYDVDPRTVDRMVADKRIPPAEVFARQPDSNLGRRRINRARKTRDSNATHERVARCIVSLDLARLLQEISVAESEVEISVSVPVFAVVGRAPRDSAARPDTSPSSDMNDRIPF